MKNLLSAYPNSRIYLSLPAFSSLLSTAILAIRCKPLDVTEFKRCCTKVPQRGKNEKRKCPEIIRFRGISLKNQNMFASDQ